MKVEVFVLLSKRKNQHFAYGEMLTFSYIEFLVEGRMYEVLRLYFDLSKQGILITDPSARSTAKAQFDTPTSSDKSHGECKKPVLIRRAGFT